LDIWVQFIVESPYHNSYLILEETKFIFKVL
jgi:hypothetical protein